MNNEDQNDEINAKSLETDLKTVVEEHRHSDDSQAKSSRLAKFNLVLTILGLGALGYLHFSEKSSTEETIAKSKATMKHEIASEMREGFASSQQLQALVEKNAELEVKIEGYSSQIANLEMKSNQLEAELEKNAGLRKKIAELESMLKKTKVAAKPAASKITKITASRKAAKKGRR